jgi:hypothetical protein
MEELSIEQEVITSLEGVKEYSLLSHRQRGLIKDSLSIQKKAIDGDAESRKIIRDGTCFAAIAVLEGWKDMNGNMAEMAPPDFFETGDFDIPDSLDDLFRTITDNDHPCVVMIRTKFSDSQTGSHAFMVIGKNSRGDLVVWEKIGPMQGFRLGTLWDVMNDMSQDKIDSFKIRPLKIS